jgi:predicted LPLAT superfamily acyltransferase
MSAIEKGHTACVEALVAAKAALDIQDVSYARLLACPVTLILCLYVN